MSLCFNPNQIAVAGRVKTAEHFGMANVGALPLDRPVSIEVRNKAIVAPLFETQRHGESQSSPLAATKLKRRALPQPLRLESRALNRNHNRNRALVAEASAESIEYAYD